MGQADADLEVSNPIVINYNSGLSSHPSVRSGDGTGQKPFIISDYSIDCTSSGRAAIAIRNTTYYVVFRNISIQASSNSPAIILLALNSGGWQAQNIVFENVTVIGGGQAVNMYVPRRVVFSSCNFDNPSGTGDIIFAYYAIESTFINCTFDCPDMDIDIDYSSTFNFLQNKGRISNYQNLNWRYSNFANNTLVVNNLELQSGYASDLQGNHLTSKDDSTYLITLADCNRIKIANNTLHGGADTILVYHPNSYSPVYTNYPKAASLRFEYNWINRSTGRGIYFYYATGHPALTYVNVLFNRITNCSSFGISIRGGGHATTVIWHNVFEYNHGSGTTYSASNTQAEDYYAQLSWDNGEIGNFWRDFTGPDMENDGFVDGSGYGIQAYTSQKDEHPVTNPYFDFEVPYLKVLSPRGRFPSNSYLNLSWETYDSLSGMQRMEIRQGLQPWIDVTHRTHYGIYLVQGSHRLKFRATDNGNLYNLIEMDVIINQTKKPFDITTPPDGSFHGSTNIQFSWGLIPEFVPRNMSTSLDGDAPVERNPTSDFTLSAPEGNHQVVMRFYDHYNNLISHTVTFTVDLTDPVIDITFPAQGSVISNNLVHFRWDASDNTEVDKVLVSIDQGDMVEKGGNGFDELLDGGPHTITVTAVDLAGNMEQDSLAFVVSKNTSLNIISPRLSRPTKETSLVVSWEYLIADLGIGQVEVKLDNKAPATLGPGTLSYEMEILEEGEHRISVIAEDLAGNVVSDSVDVIVDWTPPTIGFVYPEPGVFLNTSKLSIEWSSYERWGFDHYELYVDGNLQSGGLTQGRYNLELGPGQHDILVKAFDQAGNMGRENITVNIDLSSPTLRILEPLDDVITDQYVTFKWESEDDSGISHMNFTLDGKRTDVGLSTSRQVQLSEGKHKFVLYSVDIAGNVRSISKEYIVDLTEPVIRIENISSGYIKQWRGYLKWSIEEAVGLKSLVLKVDDTTYQIDVHSTFFEQELNEGEHTIVMKATDMGGHTTTVTMNFIIDLSLPKLSKPSEETIVKGSSAEIFWELSESENNLTWSLHLDGSEVRTSIPLSNGRFKFAELSPGNHSAILTLEDQAGNTRELVWDFVIQDTKGGGSHGGGGSAMIAIAIILLVLVGAAGMGGFFWLKGRKREEKKVLKLSEAAKKPDKIKIGGGPAHAKPLTPPVRPAPMHHHHAHTGHGPGSGPEKTGGEHGYIRPETKKKKKPEKVIVDAPIHKKEPEVQKKKDRPIFIPPEEKKGESVEEWGEIEDWEETEEIEEWSEMEEL
ncbi:MAG: Ig-like domain-containing protein [Thermoplasmatota archaeon]